MNVQLLTCQTIVLGFLVQSASSLHFGLLLHFSLKFLVIINSFPAARSFIFRTRNTLFFFLFACKTFTFALLFALFAFTLEFFFLGNSFGRKLCNLSFNTFKRKRPSSRRRRPSVRSWLARSRSCFSRASSSSRRRAFSCRFFARSSSILKD